MSGPLAATPTESTNMRFNYKQVDRLCSALARKELLICIAAYAVTLGALLLVPAQYVSSVKAQSLRLIVEYSLTKAFLASLTCSISGLLMLGAIERFRPGFVETLPKWWLTSAQRFIGIGYGALVTVSLLGALVTVADVPIPSKAPILSAAFGLILVIMGLNNAIKPYLILRKSE